MKIIQIDGANLDSEHICCAIGDDRENRARAESKKSWMREQLGDGLVFRRLDERGKVFIEYMPIEKAWKPISGTNHMVIHCLWVSGKFKGKGLSSQLLGECIEDARNARMDGIAVVTGDRARPFLTDRRFFERHGFATVDTAPPYFELMTLRLRKGAEDPAFTKHARAGTCPCKKGLFFVYSCQCPFMDEYVALLGAVARRRGIPQRTLKLRSSKEAKEKGSPFGTLGIYYEGAFQTHELMPEAKFERFLDELVR